MAKAPLPRAACWLFVTAIFLLTLVSRHGTCKKCNDRGSAPAARHDVHLDLTLFIPEDIVDPRFRDFLSQHARERVELFRDHVSQGVKSLTLRPVVVNSFVTQERDCYDIVSEAGFADPGFIEHVEYGSINMLKSAVFVLQRLEQERPTFFASDDDGRTVHMFVIFTDNYSTEANYPFRLSPSFPIFRGDTTDTCESQAPPLALLQVLFSMKGVGLFLVTPNETLRQEWDRTFKQGNSLLYPSEAALDAAALEAKHPVKSGFDPADTVMANFVKNQAFKLACKFFGKAALPEGGGDTIGPQHYEITTTAPPQDKIYNALPLSAASYRCCCWLFMAIVAVLAVA